MIKRHPSNYLAIVNSQYEDQPNRLHITRQQKAESTHITKNVGLQFMNTNDVSASNIINVESTQQNT